MISSCQLEWCPCDETTGCSFCAKDGNHVDQCKAHDPTPAEIEAELRRQQFPSTGVVKSMPTGKRGASC